MKSLMHEADLVNYRIYGNAPYRIAVIHGGPGAAGEMAPVAQMLAKKVGVLEPFQTALSITEQIEELKVTLENHGDLPGILIGFSWGAWLSFLFTANHPHMVKKLILISSGPFEEKYASDILEKRLSRLTIEERKEVQILEGKLDNLSSHGQNTAFRRFGILFSKADTFDPLPDQGEKINYRADIFQSVWPEASRIRKNGELLSAGQNIQCPVIAIHGDYDTHPAEGVREPLSKIIQNFQFHLLKDCGHKPWIEKRAKVPFYKKLETIMNQGPYKIVWK